MVEKKILIEVLNGTKAMGGCDCSSGCPAAQTCGPDEAPEEMAGKLSTELVEEFGSAVEVKYVNIDEEGMDKYPVLPKVLAMGYPYPITLINGQPKFAGRIVAEEIIKTIAQEMEKTE